MIRHAVALLAIFWAGCLVGYGTRRFGHPAWTGFVAGGIGIVLGAWLAFALGLLS